MSHLDWTRCYLGQFKCILQGSIAEHVMCRVISLHISLQTIQFKILELLHQSDKLFCIMAVKVIRGHVPRTLYSFSNNDKSKVLKTLYKFSKCSQPVSFPSCSTGGRHALCRQYLYQTFQHFQKPTLDLHTVVTLP